MAQTFDAATHTYWDDAQRLMSVSEVLDLAGLKGAMGTHGKAKLPAHVQARIASKGDFGTEVHEATALFDDGIGFDLLPMHLHLHVEAWDLFLTETPEGKLVKRPYRAIEEPLFWPAMGVAGTPDRIDMDGRIVDIKTGVPMAYHRWQLALYAAMCTSLFKGLKSTELARVAVYFKRSKVTGAIGVSPVVFTDPNDIDVALSALTVVNARRRFKLV
jgi:hypothetical protein